MVRAKGGKSLKEEFGNSFFKTSHLGDSFRQISLPRKVNKANIELIALNVSEQKISHKKYESLMCLCQGKNPVIRQQVYKDFYLGLDH